MIIGYARTSTREQLAGFEAQIAELNRNGCKKLYQEQVSAVKEREQLSAAMGYLREGDVLVVCKLDRLARSVPHLCQIVEALEEKGATLRILNIGLDSSTPTGKLMLTMLGAIAQFEREMMLERQRDGIAAAKEQGTNKSPKTTGAAKNLRSPRSWRGGGKNKRRMPTTKKMAFFFFFGLLSSKKTAAGVALIYFFFFEFFFYDQKSIKN